MTYQFHLTIADVLGLIVFIAAASIYGFLLLWAWWCRKQEAKRNKDKTDRL